MSVLSLDGWQSSLVSEQFEMSAVSQVFTPRNVPTDSTVHPPLSVGKSGVTEQLENIAKSLKTDGRKLVVEGDIVINSRSDRRGASGLALRTGSVSLIYIVLEPRIEKIYPRFAHHLIRSVAFQDEFYRFGTGIVADLWSTRYERMSQIRIPLPPLETQQRIADYLDQETAEIDAAVADLDRYVKLLEKRVQVLINSLFNSEVEFTKLRDQAVFTPGFAFSSDSFSEESKGPRLLRGVNVKAGRITAENSVFANSDMALDSKYKLVEGDLVLGMDRPFIGSGVRVSFVPAEFHGGYLVQRVLKVEGASTLRTRLINLFLRSQRFVDYLTPDFTGISVPHLSETQVSNFKVPYFNDDETEVLVSQLDLKLTEIETLIAESTKLRELLLKRRSVLITDVVTGRKQV